METGTSVTYCSSCSMVIGLFHVTMLAFLPAVVVLPGLAQGKSVQYEQSGAVHVYLDRFNTLGMFLPFSPLTPNSLYRKK